MYCYINRSQNQAGTLSKYQPSAWMQWFTCSIHFSQKVFWNSDFGMPFRKVWTAFTTLLSKLNWQPVVISWELETARNHRGPNQDYRGGRDYVDLLAGQPSFHNLVVCGRTLSWCKIHRCFNSDSSFEYAAATVAIPHGNWRLDTTVGSLVSRL